MARFIATVELLCWGAFVVVWAAGAVDAARHGGRPQRRLLGGSMWLLLAGVWLLNRSHIAPWSALAISGPWEAPLSVLGAALLVASTAFTLWARVVLGRMWSRDPMVREGHELRTTGPYAVTRHPIYTGILGMMAGTALLRGGGWMVAVTVLAALYIAVKVRAEERLMADTFGARHAEYRRRTPRLLPWPRPSRTADPDPPPRPSP